MVWLSVPIAPSYRCYESCARGTPWVGLQSYPPSSPPTMRLDIRLPVLCPTWPCLAGRPCSPVALSLHHRMTTLPWLFPSSNSTAITCVQRMLSSASIFTHTLERKSDISTLASSPYRTTLARRCGFIGRVQSSANVTENCLTSGWGRLRSYRFSRPLRLLYVAMPHINDSVFMSTVCRRAPSRPKRLQSRRPLSPSRVGMQLIAPPPPYRLSLGLGRVVLYVRPLVTLSDFSLFGPMASCLYIVALSFWEA